MSLRHTYFSICTHFHDRSLVFLYLHSLSQYVSQTHVFLYLHSLSRYITRISLFALTFTVRHSDIHFSICTHFHRTSLRHTGLFERKATARPTNKSVSPLLMSLHVINRCVSLFVFSTLAHILLKT